METTFIIGIAGFAAAFILLFFLAAKYREAAADEATFSSTGEVCSGSASQGQMAQIASALKRSNVGNINNPLALEVADLKQQLKEMHYKIEELKLVGENKNADTAKSIAHINQRLNTFEEEYLAKLQPTLVGLIEELENLKVSGSEQNPS
ncbi:hypothetical protein Dip518_000135 [Parelusimicrobium proximum]|uniref:hypothetical protein n=1 Tax=Parelusimicrobium proximum TaxID=3228953 RepID=UPI003D16C5C6